jgi:hypothetical protein
MVEPVLSTVLQVPLDVRMGNIEAMLAGPVTRQYDTVFLDTWDTLDASLLPSINRLRDLALRHLAPGGRLLMWGYRWMVRLFEEACRQLLAVPAAQRRSWLAARAASSARVTALLGPVLDQFEGQSVGDMEAALPWCRQYVVWLAES